VGHESMSSDASLTRSTDFARMTDTAMNYKMSA